ncbi:MAG: sugar phosphate isomerase/epimerase, partial [Chloroflexales bacterium]|nr:sugar phosphate isomerase/epimerase [Chloroflexales bacterium]
AQQLRALGLEVLAAHAALPLGAGQQSALELAATFGCRRIVWHGWPRDARYGSLDGIRALAEEYNAAAKVAAANGLELGLHNHWWEMEPVEGRLPYQLLLELLDPTIFFELDVYWAKTAGRDPVALIAELGTRAPLLHIKDGPATPAAPMTAVGDGVLDMPAIIGATRASAEWLVVELDVCATNMLHAVERSYGYLVGRGLARGNK